MISRKNFLKKTLFTTVGSVAASSAMGLTSCASHSQETSDNDTNNNAKAIELADAFTGTLPEPTPSQPITGKGLLPQQPFIFTPKLNDTTTPFQHGVASGDPLYNRVVLWTRVSVPHWSKWKDRSYYDNHIKQQQVFEVLWEVATDEGMKNLVAHGYSKAKKNRDFTVKIDPQLPHPNTTYYYRFQALGWYSPIGRTKTAPLSNANNQRFKMALFSCSDFSNGFYNAYANVAKMKDVDLVLHVGDYIYELGYSGALLQGRGHNPLTAPSNLEGFRKRFRQYRTDPDLQECHRQHPFVVVWDDHEFVNNFWPNQNNAGWQKIKQDAPRAYEEWMPLRRIPNPDDADEFILYRSFNFGRLLSLSMLDVRRYRSEPNGNKTNDPSRSMLGAVQEKWLLEKLQQSQENNWTWKVIGQQLIFSPAKHGGKDNLKLGLGDDIWNGYIHSRNVLLDTIEKKEIKNTVILSGDWHTSMAFNVAKDPFNKQKYNKQTGEGAVAVEFVSPAVTSNVWKDGGASENYRKNPHMKFHNGEKNGYVVLEFTSQYCQGDFKLLNSRKKNDSKEVHAMSLRTKQNKSNLQTIQNHPIGIDHSSSALVSQAARTAKKVT